MTSIVGFSYKQHPPNVSRGALTRKRALCRRGRRDDVRLLHRDRQRVALLATWNTRNFRGAIWLAFLSSCTVRGGRLPLCPAFRVTDSFRRSPEASSPR